MAIETIRDLLNAYYGVIISPRFQRNADIIGGVVQVLPGDWREDGELISQEWRGFANGGASSCLILETLIEKPLPETKT